MTIFVQFKADYNVIKLHNADISAQLAKIMQIAI